MEEKRVVIYVVAICEECEWWYSGERNVLKEEEEEQRNFLIENAQKRANAHQSAKGHSVSLL